MFWHTKLFLDLYYYLYFYQYEIYHLLGCSTSETVSCLSTSVVWRERAASSTGEWKQTVKYCWLDELCLKVPACWNNASLSPMTQNFPVITGDFLLFAAQYSAKSPNFKVKSTVNKHEYDMKVLLFAYEDAERKKH